MRNAEKRLAITQSSWPQKRKLTQGPKEKSQLKVQKRLD